MDINQYSILKYKAGFRILEDQGFLRITGKDRINFLHRQSTNDLMKLTPESPLITVLTSATARILDVLTIIMLSDQTLGIIPLAGQADKTTQFLKKRIFFMDKVAIENISGQYDQIQIEGPQAEERLKAAGLLGDRPSLNDMISSNNQKILIQGGAFGISYLLLSPPDLTDQITQLLKENEIVQIDQDIFETVRIEAGIPASGKELIEDYTPLEINLHDFISANKGCYTGQEIIARQITYDKITKKLIGLFLSSPTPINSPVMIDSKQVGEITSYTDSPSFGPIALAVVKRPFFESQTEVLVQSLDQLIPATVTDIPFH